ncbi:MULTISPECIES: hypothetical protein [Zunongwangia]|jgi:hypothetical protein|uniref:Secreted protein n=2 Tax=Zunongwangia profunda TaxID=398743 RepID=D5BLL5_ZUNPS|nr:hypothetical protein [Zunongwangia profunda]MAC65438.1 hypothetical protein [Flavobacteriaceae bacterium]MAS70152.1 hypothetical protein [Zunongwangia sp.]ADF51981.1 conserved hypothetical protein [Zunongwangia profunda SM-A87]MCC4227973.1 hypothetical protein [Zunongwangia profunda]HAJ81543.1 hypothetical protein [Zunongwangia profunda]|tara:strand:+ start:150 stop:500 length:351 start_codon:yes stop_codon:yes gene_type:complete
MKKFKSLLLALAIAFCSTVAVNANNPEKAIKPDPRMMSIEISSLLKHHKLNLKKDIRANVLLAINKDHEIVVLSVEAESETVKRFIKEKLNYKKIHCTVNPDVEEFKLPVTLKANA